jgi:hypothetical protein
VARASWKKGKILCFEVEEGRYEFDFEDVLALKRGEYRTHKDAILSVSEKGKTNTC